MFKLISREQLFTIISGSGNRNSVLIFSVHTPYTIPQTEVKTEHECFNLIQTKCFKLTWKFYENIHVLVSFLSKYYQMKFHCWNKITHISWRGLCCTHHINMNIRFPERQMKKLLYNIHTFIKCTGFNCVQAVKIHIALNSEQTMLFSLLCQRFYVITTLPWKIKTYVLQILTFCVGPSAILLLANCYNNQCGTSNRSGVNGFINLSKLRILTNVRFETGNCLYRGGRIYSVTSPGRKYDLYRRNYSKKFY